MGLIANALTSLIEHSQLPLEKEILGWVWFLLRIRVPKFYCRINFRRENIHRWSEVVC